jgi:EmrB/QacA subfamily drug resistance transporter
MDAQTVHRRRWLILGVLIFSLLVVVLDNTILNVALKTIADPRAGLGASQADLEWAINSYTLVFAGLLFTWGVVGDRMGRKAALLAALILFGGASLISAYCQTPGQLIGARALMGIGGAGVLPATLSIINHVFEPRERGKAIGIWSGAVGLAIAIGPITGGVLLEHFWWGSVFLVNVPIVAAGILAIALVVPESKDPHPGRLDPLGVLLSILGLVSLVYGIIEGGKHGDWLSPAVLLPLAAGAVVLALFIWHERRTAHPALDVTLFRDARFSAAIAVVALTFFALMGVMFFMVFYLQSVRGYSPLEAGVRLLPLALALLISSPRSAGMVDRYGAKLVCATGLGLVTVAFVSYLGLEADTSIWVLAAIFFVQGYGMGMVMPPATTSILSSLPRERSGVGSAIGNTARQVGGAMGVAVLGSILSSVYRDRMEPLLGFLPADVRQGAAESIPATLAVAERLGPRGESLVGPAGEAFMYGMHITAACCAVIGLLGVLVVYLWLPGARPGSAEPVESGREPAQV